MKDAIITLFITLFWVFVFAYLLSKGMIAVAVISAILLGMTLAFATSNEN